MAAKEGTFYDDGDGTSEIVSGSSSDGYYIHSREGYSMGVDMLCRMEDTGNGYIAYFPSYASHTQDNYICMDYAEADYLFKLLNYIRKNK